MSEKLKNETPLRRGVTTMAAIGGASLALTLAGTHDASPFLERNPVVALPGLKLKTNDDQALTLRNSSLVLLQKARNSADWQPICSANKVEVNQKSYVQTATHCVARDGTTQTKAGVVASYRDKLSRYEFSVARPVSSPYDQFVPLAKLDRFASFATKKSVDISLGTTTDNTLDYKYIQPLKTADMVTTSKQPVPGQEVRTVGSPVTILGDFNLTEGTGTYVGRLHREKATYDVVGIEADRADQVTCFKGSSGSSAMFSDGSLTGPTAYLTGNIDRIDDAPRTLDAGYLKDQVRDDESGLGLDLDQFEVLCHYPVAPESGVTRLAAELEANRP